MTRKEYWAILLTYIVSIGYTIPILSHKVGIKESTLEKFMRGSREVCLINAAKMYKKIANQIGEAIQMKLTVPSDCNKTAYQSKEAGEIRNYYLQGLSLTIPKLYVYKCTKCKHYHLTKTNPNTFNSKQRHKRKDERAVRQNRAEVRRTSKD